MGQQSLTVAGLILDLLGTVALFTEWMVADLRAATDRRHQAAIQGAHATIAFSSDPDERERAAHAAAMEGRKAAVGHNRTLGLRRGIVKAAASLIILGFFLQLFGALQTPTLR